MGCFVACFRSSDDVNRRKHRHRHRRRKVLPPDQATAISNAVRAFPSAVDSASDRLSLILKARERPEEQQPSRSTRKRVTFDSNVKTYELEHVEAEAEAYVSFEKEAIDEENERELAEITLFKSQSEDASTVSSVSSYPSNHRYLNCRDSDEDDDEDYADSDLDHDHIDTDDDDDIEDEEYDNFSDDESGRSSARVFTDEVDSCLSVCGCPEKTELQTGVKRAARDRNACVHSVLKPVENTSQWKAVKAKDKHRSNPPHKENLAINEAPMNSFGTEQSFKESSFGYKSKTCQPKNTDQGVAVDASLSNWLSSLKFTPPSKTSTGISSLLTPESQGSNSPKILEDRPILGASTMEELKQFSTSPSPRRLPHRCPDEIPIIGTVGKYWNHSSSVEDSRPAPFKRVSTTTSSNYREMCVN